MTRNPNLMDSIRATASARLTRAAEVLRDNARNRMNRSGGGEDYSDQRRRASAPGESPVSQSGELSDSITAFPARPDGDNLIAATGSTLYRAIWIEKGTAAMAPRPLLLPTLLASQEQVLRIMSGGEA